MTVRMTVFTATLCQDSALSISGLDRQNSTQTSSQWDSGSDHNFRIIDGTPIILGRSIKGAAVAMARRFFDPLPLSISGPPHETNIPLQRSAWECSNTRPITENTTATLRAGVGILQKTGACKPAALYDREVIPAGCSWPLEFRVDWQLAKPEAHHAEGILGYILQEHWAKDRCWLGAGVARGLGWCHITNLQAFRMNTDQYTHWVKHGRQTLALPSAQTAIPVVPPTRSWYFATRDIQIAFGEYYPEPASTCWGVDMLAIGTHASEQAQQNFGNGTWSQPWATSSADKRDPTTDRALLMDRLAPLLPGSSVRGPLRHAYSRLARKQGKTCIDPLTTATPPDSEDPGAKLFGTTRKSSAILIRDAVVQGDWSAAILHHHAEDEFAGGSYETSKRDGARLLHGTFSVRIVVDSATKPTMTHLQQEIDLLIKFGQLSHLPLGGNKTQGAGWGKWSTSDWIIDTAPPVQQTHNAAIPQSPILPDPALRHEPAIARLLPQLPNIENMQLSRVYLHRSQGSLEEPELFLGRAAAFAQTKLLDPITAWWCEPAIDFSVAVAPPVFGRTWPNSAHRLRVEEVLFCTATSSIRMATSVRGIRWVYFEEAPTKAASHPTPATLRKIPAQLHQQKQKKRFNASLEESGNMFIHEWLDEHLALLGYTLVPEGTLG